MIIENLKLREALRQNPNTKTHQKTRKNMASIRNLKKAVKSICGELFADCLALSSIKDADSKDVKEIMARVAATYQDYVARVDNPEPGISPREYFSKVRADFISQVNEISEELLKA